MIKNSYQIFNCIETKSTFKLLSTLNPIESSKNQLDNNIETVTPTGLEATNKKIYKQITDEITLYHKNSNLDISVQNSIINEESVINNKFIFKDGYYFCSYLYKYKDKITSQETIYISEPTYEYSEYPLCSEEEFTNIIIKNTIPLNLNIIGVIFYYKYSFDKQKCKTNIFTFNKITEVIHKDEEKHIIDIIYFNTLGNTIKYELTYMYFKNINYNTFNERIRNKLKYIHFDLNDDETQFTQLSKTIETNIYDITNELILKLAETKKKLNILEDLEKTTKKKDNSIFNVLQTISKNNSNILNCNINKYTKYINTNQIIEDLLNKIHTEHKILLTYIITIRTNYQKIIDDLHSLDNFEQIILNKQTYNLYREKFINIINKRGTIENPDEITFFGLRPKINEKINSISNNITELNATINVLETSIGESVGENNGLIETFFQTVKYYNDRFEIDMNKLNIDQNNTEKKLNMFIIYDTDKLKCNVIKQKILPTYLTNDIIIEDYTIESLPDINMSIELLDIFKIDITLIDKIYDEINILYNYLGNINDNMKYKTLYDIFFNTYNIDYKDYVTHLVIWENEIRDNFSKINNEGIRIVINQNTSENMKALPKNDDNFITIYKRKNKLLNVTDNVIKNIVTYMESYDNKIKNIKNIYFTPDKKNTIKKRLKFSQQNISNICITVNIMDEYNTHIKNLIEGTIIYRNNLQAQRDAKKFENLSIQEQKYIKIFLETNKNIYSLIYKYITNTKYNISNNLYTVCTKSFNTFIGSVITDMTIENDDMDILNIFFNLRNCLLMKKTQINDHNTRDEFIVIVYCFCISILCDYPNDLFKHIFNIYNNKLYDENVTNDTVNIRKIFDEILHNKLYLYNENNMDYIKIISNIQLVLNKTILEDIDKIQPQLISIRDNLSDELKNPKYINIQKKLVVIKYFITHNTENESRILKINTNRGEYEKIDKFFKTVKNNNIINFNLNINSIINKESYYKINQIQKNKKKINTKYCVNLTTNNKYECDICDFTKKSIIKNLKSCPPNLPYNVDSQVSDSHINSTSKLAFGKDLYRIFSYISEPGKELLYKRGRVIYGKWKVGMVDTYNEWHVNKTYKNYILLDKIDENKDDIIIVKSNKEAVGGIQIYTDNLNIINKNVSEFYLNNFFIQNIVSEINVNDPIYKFPNSHQLYIKQEDNYQYVYFIENDIKYYMYLNIEKNKTTYDIIFRENTTRTKKPFIKNYAKWRFIRSVDYIENIFTNVRDLYNIRSKIYFDKEAPAEINGLLSNDNTCYKYDVLLNSYLNNNYDLMNNTKFKLTGYNNNYNISPYIKNPKSIFKDVKIIQFLNYNNRHKEVLRKLDPNWNNMSKKNPIYNKYWTELNKYDKMSYPDDENKKSVFYLLKDPESESYLYLDDTRNVVEFVQLYEDNSKTEQFSPDDFIPNNFLWMAQNSNYNDNIIQIKLTELQTNYNNMLDGSIKNIEKNIKNKQNKQNINTVQDIINQVTEIKEKKELIGSQTGGNLLTITDTNINDINNLIKKLNNIKYNDYILLLTQLDIIRQNSKQVLKSPFLYEGINNRILIKYIDHITETDMNMFIYFKKTGSNRFICDITDIVNIKTMTFDILSEVQEKPEIIIDNNPLNDSNVNIIDSGSIDVGVRNTITITIPNTIVEFSQMFIYMFETELILNIKRSDIYVYYNRNPIYNKLTETIIRNTNKNNIYNILNGLNLGKSNKKIYDFSIKLDDTKLTKIHKIDKNSIIKHIRSNNNKVGNFYIQKNRLEPKQFYSSKIFYISNDKNILYIQIHNTKNKNELYQVPCIYSRILENNPTNEDIINYICKSIFTHIKILNIKNESDNFNKIFDYINILYKNNKQLQLLDVLSEDHRKGSDYDFKNYLNIPKKTLDIYFNMVSINDRFDEELYSEKIPNKLTIVFNRAIKNKFIHFDIKFMHFIELQNLYSLLPNFQFITLKSLNNKNELYTYFIENVIEVLQFIKNIKNNTNENDIEDAFDLRNIQKIMDNEIIKNIVKYYFETNNDTNLTDEQKKTQEEIQKNEIILYLYSLLNSKISITNYFIDFALTIINIIQEKYNEYSEKINILLEKDPRFLNCIYKPAPIIDVIYNIINYFSNYDNNSSELLFHKVFYGFYFKNSDDIYVNKIVQTTKDVQKVDEIYLISYKNLIDNYSKIYPDLPKKNTKNEELNKKYTDLHTIYINDVNYLLNELINMKYTNIKIHNKKSISSQNSQFKKAEDSLKTYLQNENSIQSKFIDYTNIKFNTNKVSKIINEGDVIRYKFVRNTTTNKLFNIINLFLPYKMNKINWTVFNEIIDIHSVHNDIYKLINKKLNIYNISSYNKLFETDLIDSYIPINNLLLKEVLPFKNDYSSIEVENSCYIKILNNDLYLYLNKYKYKISIRKLIYSNLYLIYRTIHNINYYIEFVVTDDSYGYKWVKEDYNLIDKLINKLLFISITTKNVTDTTDKIDVTNTDMIEIEYLNRFSNSFSNINKFISNIGSDCQLEETYYTIHSKKFNKIIHNNNIINLLDICLNNVDSTFILKDKYSKINNDVGNFKYYLSNNECNSYVIYNQYKNIILDDQFNFVELGSQNLTLQDVIKNIGDYKNYSINLKYFKDKNIYYQLTGDCVITKKMKKIKILNKSLSDKIAENNKYFIYVLGDRETSLFQTYLNQTKLTEYILEEEKSFYIIPLNNINKKQLLQKKINSNTNMTEYENLDVSLVPISQNSDYYVIRNNRNEYLQTINIINYKKPLRVSLKFILTNKIDSSYLWYIKKNVENVNKINISNTNKKCMVGGQTLLLNNKIKEDLLTKENNKYTETSKYRDLCHNNTFVNFINHNIETEDDINYISCRKKCEEKSDICVGFSVNDIKGTSKCSIYENKNENSIIYYDCRNSITTKNYIGEIKNNESIIPNKMDLIDNNLYYISSKTDESLYVTFNKKESVFKNKNNLLYCSTLNLDKQDIYSDNIFKLNIQKSNVLNGNVKFISLMSTNKHILGSYEDNAGNIIDIKYDIKTQRYIWYHIKSDTPTVDRQKWYLENTNNIYEYIVNEGKEGKEGEGFYCKYYKTGYNTLKVLKNEKNLVNTVIGPETVEYTKIYIDKNVSVFKYIENLKDIDTSNSYEGNIFMKKNISNYYNLYTIINYKKHYFYLDNGKDQQNLIKITNDENDISKEISSDKYLWKFDKYTNKLTSPYSYEKILAGGTSRRFNPFNPLNLNKKPVKKQVRTITGGVRLNDLISGNSYYIKSQNDEYLCANKYYKEPQTSETKSVFAISIDSDLATNPNRHSEYNKKFVRASIDLSENPKYNLQKKHIIDDDILWKLIIVEDTNDNDNDINIVYYYKFYNIKHNIYIKFNDSSLEYDLFELNATSSNIYYNLRIKGQNNTKLAVTKTDNSDKIYYIDSVNQLVKNVGLWEFINPTNLQNKNPYFDSNNDYLKLEDGKIYRIINEGVKQYNIINTYLTINEFNHELLIPYNEKLFNNNITTDPTLWKCIINKDNTYSFILLKNNKKLGDFKNNTSLFKNIGNKLELKNVDYTINNEYLTDKFYIQHSTNQYYNIINSKNLNYNICGFSNNINTYDNYTIDNIKYTHKIANNSTWLLTCKLLETSKQSKLFSDEVFYYLYPTKNNKLNYGFSHTYNEIYNDIYREEQKITTTKNILNNVIVKNSDTFKKNKGFTLQTQVNITAVVNKDTFGINNFSIILTTLKHFYTIRFIDNGNKIMLIRIIENEFKKTDDDGDGIKQIKEVNSLFKILDHLKNNDGEINMKLVAPDIYTEINIYKLKEGQINLTYDNEYVNIFINNKLITFFKIKQNFRNIYYTSNINCEWTDTIWWKHNILLDIPLWKTQNIDNFVNNKPGIKFTSKVNRNTSFNANIEQEKIGYFYIKNNNNEYLSIVVENEKLDYETKWISEKPESGADSNCLWKLYDSSINIPNYVNVLEYKESGENDFICSEDNLSIITNTDKTHWSNFDNSTNIILKAKINNSTKQVDEMSNYMYSIIDINNDKNNSTNKICTWTHNSNGHTSVDYNKFDLGSHFTTDIWNIQLILGVTPKPNDKYIVKYKENIGTIIVDNLINNYSTFRGSTTVQCRWHSWDEIKTFNTINSQNNKYIDTILPSQTITNNICISLNDDGLNASCGYVADATECATNDRSLLYMANKNCDDVLNKNYKLLQGTSMTQLTGGSIWIKPEWFYLNNKIGNTTIFNSSHNIIYEPSYSKIDITEWKWTDIRSKNIIYNRILNTFKYDGYIEDEKNQIIRAVILPKNYVLFNYIHKKTNYIKGKFKAYNCSYKNIKIIEMKKYLENYNNYYITIETVNTIPNTQQENNKINKINKCYDLIKENICISNGNFTSISKNIKNMDYLLDKNNIFKNTNDYFRIVTTDGKYLSDIYVNNTFYCIGPKSTDIIFQAPFDTVNIQTDIPHLMHSTSKESLWFINETAGTYNIENVYSGKKLSGETLYIEFAENKYFKQQIINKTNSTISYDNQDLYYIYYKKDNNTKKYISYQNMTINNKYNKSGKFIESNSPTPFIIKKANYNLDILTDETEELNNNILNICYNKTSICDKKVTIINLLENNYINCLNINYSFYRYVKNTPIVVGQPTHTPTEITEYDIFNLINKNNDNFLSLSHAGKFRITFVLKQIKLKKIEYRCSSLFKPINISVHLSELDTDKKEILLRKNEFPHSRISAPILIEDELLSNNLSDCQVHFDIECDKGFTLNYIELFGIQVQKKFKTEINTFNKNNIRFDPVNINKSLISKKTNLENNFVKIKNVIRNKQKNNENEDNNTNIIHIKNKKNYIKNITDGDDTFKFILVFNPLLNIYMFYINNNEYLSIENEFYFNLIKINSFKTYNIFYIQSFNKSKLYLNINNSTLTLSTIKQEFMIININDINDTDHNITLDKIVNYNNFINNNILYNYDSQIVSMTNANNLENYFNITSRSSLENNSSTVKQLLLNRQSDTEWNLIDKNTDGMVIIRNLKNINENIYTFSEIGSGIEYNAIIQLFNTYDKLSIKTHSDIKNKFKYKDIDKTIEQTTRYEKQLYRDKKYRNYENIIDRIYINSIIVLKINNNYISVFNNSLELTFDLQDTATHFMEISVGDPKNKLYKLWNVENKKFIVFDVINNKFTISEAETEYDNIDILNDIDVLATFQKNGEATNVMYTLYYFKKSGETVYLSLGEDDILMPNVMAIESIYTYNDTFSDKSQFVDYCKTNCKIENKLENRLKLDTLYSLINDGNDLYISMGKYTIRPTSLNSIDKTYFNINTSLTEYDMEENITFFKEYKKLIEIFEFTGDYTNIKLKMKILTVNISLNKVQQLYNIIIWKMSGNWEITEGEGEDKTTVTISDKIIGRFDNRFDIPPGVQFINKDIDIIYESNYNKLDFINTSYNFISYKHKPINKKYIKITDLLLDIINKFDISIYHIDNEPIDKEIPTKTQQNERAELRKILSTCSWGNCPDYNTLTPDELNKFNKNISQFEDIYSYRQRGGQLDSNMIRFIKSVDTNIDFYKTSSIEKSFISKEFTYYENSKLVDILFKKNDLLELHKVFGDKGWTNSYNSNYSKKQFLINKNKNIKDIDYYNSFRNIYPISWLERKFSVNFENQWKYNNWFEDTPHFRSLPNWKFEEAQIIEKSESIENSIQVSLSGGKYKNNKNNNKNNNNNNNNKYIYIIIIILISLLIFKYYFMKN